MEAKIVVGMGFGDEGKGITTDYLSNQIQSNKGIVVRFNGGQQAGHTVTVDGKKHVYANFGSGTGRGLPTYVSHYCTFYPPNMLNEYNTLREKGMLPSLYIHPLAILTTPWDVAWGRLREKMYQHGSCGIGVGATMMRQEGSPHKLHAVDLLHAGVLEAKIDCIGRYYRDKFEELQTGKDMANLFVYLIEQYRIENVRFEQSLSSVYHYQRLFSRFYDYHDIGGYDTYIFEGAQGIMLDMEHGIFPNVTYSHTTSKNAIEICNRLGIEDVQIYYITRFYQTRHGEGWMSPSTPYMNNNPDETNVHNEWQKDFKCVEIDVNLLQYALEVDKCYSPGVTRNLVVTCLDQRGDKFTPLDGFASQFSSYYQSWSPDSKDFREIYQQDLLTGLEGKSSPVLS